MNRCRYPTCLKRSKRSKCFKVELLRYRYTMNSGHTPSFPPSPLFFLPPSPSPSPFSSIPTPNPPYLPSPPLTSPSHNPTPNPPIINRLLHLLANQHPIRPPLRKLINFFRAENAAEAAAIGDDDCHFFGVGGINEENLGEFAEGGEVGE